MLRDCHHQSRGSLALSPLWLQQPIIIQKPEPSPPHLSAHVHKLPEKKLRVQVWGGEVFHEFGPISYIVGGCQLLLAVGATSRVGPGKTTARQILWTDSLRWTNLAQTAGERVASLSARSSQGTPTRILSGPPGSCPGSSAQGSNAAAELTLAPPHMWTVLVGRWLPTCCDFLQLPSKYRTLESVPASVPNRPASLYLVPRICELPS